MSKEFALYHKDKVEQVGGTIDIELGGYKYTILFVGTLEQVKREYHTKYTVADGVHVAELNIVKEEIKKW